MQCYISWESNTQDTRCHTIIASDEGVSISVLELALHILLQAAKRSIVTAGQIQLLQGSTATYLCLFHGNIHIPVQASKNPCKGKQESLQRHGYEVILTQMHAYCCTSIVDAGI